MKVEYNDDKLIVYLYSENIDNIDELNDKIKKIFIKLIKRYHIEFFGFNKVTIYHNKHYGIILEIERIYRGGNAIDLKIIIYKDVLMYLEFDDYCFFDKPKDFIIKNNKYYLNVDSITNIYKYLEYGKLIIKKI